MGRAQGSARGWCAMPASSSARLDVPSHGGSAYGTVSDGSPKDQGENHVSTCALGHSRGLCRACSGAFIRREVRVAHDRERLRAMLAGSWRASAKASAPCRTVSAGGGRVWASARCDP